MWTKLSTVQIRGARTAKVILHRHARARSVQDAQTEYGAIAGMQRVSSGCAERAMISLIIVMNENMCKAQ